MLGLSTLPVEAGWWGQGGGGGLPAATSQQQVLGGIGQWELGRIALSLESWEFAFQEQRLSL